MDSDEERLDYALRRQLEREMEMKQRWAKQWGLGVHSELSAMAQRCLVLLVFQKKMEDFR